jgi:predicted deacetylase
MDGSRANGASATGNAAKTIAVALHDVEPATFQRSAELRAWLSDRGVDRVTLLVIPARDLHPLGERSPETVEWLIERRRRGNSIAQHGFQHDRLRRGGWSPRLLAPARAGQTGHAGRSGHAGRAAEFAGLNDEEARRAVEAGRRVMKLAGMTVQTIHQVTSATSRAALRSGSGTGAARAGSLGHQRGRSHSAT